MGGRGFVMGGWGVTAVLALGVSGCVDAGTAHETGAAAELRFEGSASTLDDLGDGVLEGLVGGDEGSLQGWRLTEREHNEVVWPELPASAPELNFPLDYAWQNIESRNRRGLTRILPLYADRDLAFRRVECRGGTERFGTFEVLTDCWVVFEHRDQRRVYEAQIFKDVLARGGGYKIFRYYDEEPRPYSGSSSG